MRADLAVSGVSAAYVGFIACPSPSAICRSAAVTAGVRHRQSAGCENHRIAFESARPRGARRSSRSAAGRMPVTSVSVTMVTPLCRAWASSLSRTSRALCDFGNSFPDSVSSTSGNPSSLFEERDLLVERPRPHDAAQQMRRRVGDKARLVEARGQDVAASAAADENLAAAVLRAFEEQRLGAPRRREDRGHRAGGAGADYDDAWHASSDWRNVRLKRPESPSSGGAVPGVIRDTP